MSLLVDIRKKTGFSQRKMAEFLDISRGLLSMAEIGLRELPEDVFQKIQRMHQQLEHAGQQVKGNASLKKDHPVFQKLKETQERKWKDCRFKVEGLQLQLEKKQQLIERAEARMGLLNSLAKTNRVKKNPDDAEWIEYHGGKSKKQLSKLYAEVLRLQVHIEAQLGYAAVHQKILKKDFW